MNLYTQNNQFLRTNGGLWKVKPGAAPIPQDMDFIYQANDFDGTKIPNKAPNSTFGDYLAAGTLTKNGTGAGCYLSNDFNFDNYLYKYLTETELTNIKAINSYYTFYARVMDTQPDSEGHIGGIMSCRINGNHIYMIRNDGYTLHYHTNGWEVLGSDFTIDVDRVYKFTVGPGYYYAKNLDNNVEWELYDSADRAQMGNIMSTFDAANYGEGELEKFYAFAGIARQTTVEEDIAIKNVLMNQSA